jgi:hypothetical protein
MNVEPNAKSLAKNIISLNEIARKLGKRTSSLNLIDPQVKRVPWNWQDSLSSKPQPSDCFTRKISYKVNNLRVTLRVNDEYLAVDVKGPFGGSVVCSFVNNKAFESHRELGSDAICKSYGYKVYLGSGPNSESTASFLQDSSFQQLVKSLRLSQKESIHIGNGYASLYLQRFECEDVLVILESLYHLLSLLPPVDEISPSFEDLPARFKKLIPLIKRWALSDDSDRSDRINRASTKTLAQLVESIESDFSAINQYIDSFENGPLPEHAVLLGTLAECATEAQLSLKIRRAKKEPA